MIHVSSVQIESGHLYLDLQNSNAKELLRVINNIAPYAETLGIDSIKVQENGVTTLTRGLRTEAERRGRTDEPLTNPVVHIEGPSRATAQQLIIGHRLRIIDSNPQYTLHFVTHANVLPFISAYMGILLTTFGDQAVHQHHLKLAIYEICANLVEHGKRRSQPSGIGIRLEFRDQVVEGWIEDNCESFDLLKVPVPALDEKVAKRHFRGYGIAMIQQLLDDAQYESGQAHNRFYFKKRMRK